MHGKHAHDMDHKAWPWSILLHRWNYLVNIKYDLATLYKLYNNGISTCGCLDIESGSKLVDEVSSKGGLI